MTRFALLVFVGCAEDLRPALHDGGGDVRPPGSVTTESLPDGTRVSVVDASSTEQWIHVDFETQAKVDQAGAWDLRFQRFHISTNGGVSGTGGVEIAAVPNTTLSATTTSPADGFLADAADGEDTNADPDYAFEQGDGWYDYDPLTHVLTPFPTVYVVRTNGGGTIALAIQSYYDDAGTAGWFTFQWKAL